MCARARVCVYIQVYIYIYMLVSLSLSLSQKFLKKRHIIQHPFNLAEIGSR